MHSVSSTPRPAAIPASSPRSSIHCTAPSGGDLSSYVTYTDAGDSLSRLICSKRAFQTQFRRWNFPPKQKPAYKNDRLVGRIKELWERNLAQREMLRVLNEEDGFDIKPRELMRVRARNRWLLRVPNHDKARLSDIQDETESVDDTLASPEARDSQIRTSKPRASVLSNDMEHEMDPAGSDSGRQPGRRQRRRCRMSSDRSATNTRFPSEMTIDEARDILSLDASAYRAVRGSFQQICQEDSVSRKTEAGPERWEGAKYRLIRSSSELQQALWGGRGIGSEESRQLALDVICTDVTKRMRTMETRLTLGEAKAILGVNPTESRELRSDLGDVLAELQFSSKSDATPEQWEELMQKWGGRSTLVRSILVEKGQDEETKVKHRALDTVASDVMKRLRDQRSRGGTKKPRASHSGADAAGNRRLRSGQNMRSSPSQDQVDLGDGLASSTFDDMSEVSHASQMAFSPDSDAIAAHLPISLQSQSSTISDNGQSSRVLGSGLPGAMQLDSPMSSSLLLTPNSQSAFMSQAYVQQHYAQATPSAQVYQQPATACAVYLRLHPSSSFVANTNLWVATLSSQSLQELREAAVAKFPGAVCLRVEGVIKDGKGGELPLQIEQEQELSAYMAHLQGASPTFNVQLVWKAT